VIHVSDATISERTRYSDIWTKVPGFGDASVGLQDVPHFMEIVQPRAGASIIDVGTGNCAAMLEFQRLGLDAWGLDITSAVVPAGVSKFYEQPIWHEWRGAFTYAFCCDVLQFVPPEYAMLAIDRMIQQCRKVWLHISFIPDKFGAVTGEALHRTMMPFEWWLLRIATLGRIDEARDLCESGVFVVRHK